MAARTRQFHLAVLVALAVGLYANTLGHGYALDDALVLTRNEFTQAGLAGIPGLLTADSFRGYLGAQANPVFGGRYRPLSLVTFAVEIAVFGANPFTHHLGNVLLYALCCGAFYWVVAELLGVRAQRSAPGWLSLPFVAALIFTVHPIHTEVVANLKSRDEILALLFALLSLQLCLRAAATPKRAPAIAAAALFFLALLSKENAITFLAVVPLSLWFFRDDFRAGFARVMPGLGLAALIYLVLRQSSVSSVPGHSELLNEPFLGASTADAYATAFYTLGLYAKLLLWPHPLTHDYGPYHIPILSWRDGWPWLGLVVQLGLAAFALSGLRTRGIAAYAAAFYLATLAVASNLLFSVGTFLGERFLFMPSAGAAVGLARALLAGLDRWVPTPARRAPIAAAVVLIGGAALSILTVFRNPAWKDSYTLFTTDIAVSSQSALLNANVADVLLIRAAETSEPSERARLEQTAIAHLETALRVHPRYERALEMLAAVQSQRGDLDGALTTLERLFDVNPVRRNAAFNLGTQILRHHPERSSDAVRYLERAVEVRPDHADALANLGVAYYQSGDVARAIASLERAVVLEPGHAGHRANLEALRSEVGSPAIRR